MILSALLAASTPLKAPDPGKNLNMSIKRSRMTQWCWAAATVSIAARFGDCKEPRQCDVANRVFKNTFQCCPQNGNCNCQRKFSIALNEHFKDFEFNRAKRTLAFVKSEIDANRPVPIRLVVGNDGHIVVISKYWVAQGIEWFGILDPELPTAPIPKPIRCQQLLNGYNGRIWDYSHITQ